MIKFLNNRIYWFLWVGTFLLLSFTLWLSLNKISVESHIQEIERLLYQVDHYTDILKLDEIMLEESQNSDADVAMSEQPGFDYEAWGVDEMESIKYNLEELQTIRKYLNSMNEQLKHSNSFTDRYHLSNYYYHQKLNSLKFRGDLRSEKSFLIRLGTLNLLEHESIAQYITESKLSEEKFISLKSNQHFITLVASIYILIPILILSTENNFLSRYKTSLYKYLPEKYNKLLLSFSLPKIIRVWAFAIFFRIVFYIMSYFMLNIWPIYGIIPISVQGSISLLNVTIVFLIYIVLLTLITMIALLINDITHYFISDNIFSIIVSSILIFLTIFQLIPRILMFMERWVTLPFWTHTMSIDRLNLEVGVPSSLDNILIYIVFLVLIATVLIVIHKYLWQRAVFRN